MWQEKRNSGDGAVSHGIFSDKIFPSFEGYDQVRKSTARAWD
jgi:hypothetical protein